MDRTLIIGLGNPDPDLKDTYHNVGMLAVEWLAAHVTDVDGVENDIPKFRVHNNTFEYIKIKNRVFIRPLVYMNESGVAVKDALRAFGAEQKDIVVIHDDSDIPVGEFKQVRGGGSAGHKGIASIIDHLRTEDFGRIRIGIRAKDEVRRKKAGDFVLSPISATDRKIFEVVFERFSSLL